VPYVVERIVQQGKAVNAGRWFVPTGFQSKELIVHAGEPPEPPWLVRHS